MDLGRYQQGALLPLALPATNAAGSPDWPADNPVASVFSPTGTLLERIRLPAIEQGISVGMFFTARRLGPLYSATGLYSVTCSWLDSGGHSRAAAASFSVLPGGQEDGAVVSVRAVRRPNAVYLLRQAMSGGLARGRNPR